MFEILRDSDPNTGGGGDPQPQAPPFDAGAFMKSFFEQFEKTMDAKLSVLKPAEKKEEPPAEEAEEQHQPPQPNPQPHQPPTPNPYAAPKPDPRLLKMEKQLAEQIRLREEAEKRSEEKDRHGSIRTILSNYELTNPEDAFNLFAHEIKRGDGEKLVAPDGESAYEYIRKMLDGDRDYLLRPRDVGGAGAHNPGGSKKDLTPLDLDSLKPGMKPEDLDKYRAHIARVALEAMRGR